MVFYIKDPATDRVVRRLSKVIGKSMTEAVKEAVEEKLAKVEGQGARGVAEKLDELTARFARIRKSGKRADKPFFDEMWEND